MPDPTAVDPQIIDAILQTEKATLTAQITRTSGAGKAYQAAAEASALAVQDATDMLRNISTVATTAIGVALSQLLAGDPAGKETLVLAQQAIGQAATDYATICAAAAETLKQFPSG